MSNRKQRTFTLVKKTEMTHKEIINVSLCLHQKHIPEDIHKLIFKFIDMRKTFGYWYGLTPKHAANRICLYLRKKPQIFPPPIIKQKNNITTMKFTIMEITSEKKNKQWTYESVREVLENPTRIKLNDGRVVTYTYSNHLYLHSKQKRTNDN